MDLEAKGTLLGQVIVSGVSSSWRRVCTQAEFAPLRLFFTTQISLKQEGIMTMASEHSEVSSSREAPSFQAPIDA